MFGLFGKKVKIAGQNGARGSKKTPLAKKQFDQWVHDGKVSDAAQCQVHILEPMKGCRVASWTIGADVSVDTYERFKSLDGDLYALTVHRDGKPETHATTRDFWVKYRVAEEAMAAGNPCPMDDLMADLKRGSTIV